MSVGKTIEFFGTVVSVHRRPHNDTIVVECPDPAGGLPFLRGLNVPTGAANGIVIGKAIKIWIDQP